MSMATVGMVTSSTTNSSYGLHQASLVHISSSALPPSPLSPSPTTTPLHHSNGTMGSTTSLLADSGYRGGSSHFSDTSATNSNSSVFEEPSVANDDAESVGPPKLAPVSGRLEKTKEKKLIRPIAVRFASPNPSPTDKQPSSQSPSLSDTMATYAHPPDILMNSHHAHGSGHAHSNSNGFSAGRHFGKPPTKTMSLQDITPVQQTYRMSNGNTNGSGNSHKGNTDGYHPSTLPHKESSSSSAASHHRAFQQKLHQAQSLNFLHTRNGWSGNHHASGSVPAKISGHARHRSQSQSAYPTQDAHRPLQASYGLDVRQNSQPNLASLQKMTSGGEEQVYAPVSVSSVNEESDLAEENRILRNKVQDMKHQLVAMRDTMEVNEQTIFQVQDEKRRDYEGRVARLQTQLQGEKDSAHSQQRAQQQEIYRLEQDRKHLRGKLEDLQKELSRHKDQGKKVEEQKSVVAESQQEITNKRYEIKRLEGSLKRSKEEVQYEKENVKRLQIELDKARLQASKRNNTGNQQLLSMKASELAQVKGDAKKAVDQRDSLMLRVKSQGTEIDRLGALVKTKEQELAQERCEVAYLKEVNERLTAALKEKDEKVVKKESKVEDSAPPKAQKSDVVELELSRTLEKLQQLQTEKDMESTRLKKRIGEKDAELKRLQARLRERGKGSSSEQKNGQVQRRLEQDNADLQVQLAKRDQELKAVRHQVVVLQTQERNSGPALSNSILQKKEAELKACQERLHQRSAEIKYIRDKLGERDAELTALKVKLDRVHRQENGRRAGSLDRELSGTRQAKQHLESQVKGLQEENARLKEKMSRVAVGVKTLSESHLNLAKLSMTPSVPEKPKFERTDPKAVAHLQKEVGSLRQEVARAREDRDKQTAEFRREHSIWQEEKLRVIAYQKQLQLNYVQMVQKNKKLEQEIQQLNKELDREEVIQC